MLGAGDGTEPAFGTDDYWRAVISYSFDDRECVVVGEVIGDSIYFLAVTGGFVLVSTKNVSHARRSPVERCADSVLRRFESPLVYNGNTAIEKRIFPNRESRCSIENPCSVYGPFAPGCLAAEFLIAASGPSF